MGSVADQLLHRVHCHEQSGPNDFIHNHNRLQKHFGTFACIHLICNKLSDSVVLAASISSFKWRLSSFVVNVALTNIVFMGTC